MSKGISLWSPLLLTLLLVGCSSTSGEQEAFSVWQGLSQEPLPPCTASGSIFAETFMDSLGTPYRLPFEEWADNFHTVVAGVVQAHIDNVQGKGSGFFSRLVCSAPDFKAMMAPSGELWNLAASLPHWAEFPERLATLSEADIGGVLLEFLRVYECSMQEHLEFLPIQIEPLQGYCALGSSTGDPCVSTRKGACSGTYFNTKEECIDAGFEPKPLNYPELSENMEYRKRRIFEEMLVARTALEQTFALIGGMGNVRPLALELICLERLSLDLRNVLGLTGDVAACLPRIWEGRGSLRDKP